MRRKVVFLKLLGVFIGFVFCVSNSIAIVNMDGLHFKESDRSFSADLEFKLNGSTGNSNYSKAALDGQFSWATKEAINLALLGYDYGVSKQVENINKSFVHLRHIRKLTSVYDFEAFTQFEQNDFTRLKYRALLGVGLRFKVGNSDKHKAFLGLGAFYDKEEIKPIVGFADDGVDEKARANLYFISKYKASSNINISNTLYLQPNFKKTSDVRALLQSKVDFKINKVFSFRLSLDIAHDSEPYANVKKTDVSYLTGLVYSY